MTETNTATPAEMNGRIWVKALATYRRPNNARALFEVAITGVPFIALWVGGWLVLDYGYWLTLLFAIPAACFLVRLFMIQHDCGHGSFFRHRLANDWTGRIIGVLTLTPYGVWRRTHAMHHAGSGNLGRRGQGDIYTLTVAEFRARAFGGRLAYRLYRHPLVLLGIGPAYLFYVQQRLPLGHIGKGWRPWASAMGTNLALVLVATPVVWLVGFEPFLLVHVPTTLIAASAGVWLFFVQHQFDATSWEWEGDWNWHDAALHGSSHYDLPAVLRWFTANIGLHQVHHLCSRIPYYRLPAVLRDHPALNEVGRITIRDSMKCMRLALWDETRRRLVTFREARVTTYSRSSPPGFRDSTKLL